MSKLIKTFYQRADVHQIAKDLLGKVLITYKGGQITSGIIVETEAYKAPEDTASHAYNYKRTSRTEIMFAEGGVAYVYLIYGRYRLFNVITYREGQPHAVLIRALQPLEGKNIMRKRRAVLPIKSERLTHGPGRLSDALGIALSDSGADLSGSEIWIEDRGITVASCEVVQSPRVGISVPEPYLSMPWRYSIKDHPWVSPPKPKL